MAFKTTLLIVPALLGLMALGGCMDPNTDYIWDPNNSLVDPSEMPTANRYQDTSLLLPILTNLNSGYAERGTDFARATDVRPEDLKYSPADYVIGPGDLLNITLGDVSGTPGVETLKQTRVTDSGNITVPLLDAIHASGKTEAQLQKYIHDEYAKQGFLRNAEVSVTVLEMRQRTFEVAGATIRSGQYAIVQPNFRVLDALIMAGFTPNQDYPELYIVRPPPAEEAPVTPESGHGPTVTPPAPGSLEPGVLEPGHAPTTKPSGNLNLTPPSTAPASLLEDKSTEPTAKPIYVSGASTVRAPVPGGDSAVGEPATRPGNADNSLPAEPMATIKPFVFNSPLPEDKSRIIHVPLAKLQGGDLRYNIVVHPNDLLIIPSPSVGECYIGGHVQRTGVYSVNARKITIKQAIIMAGMLDPLAIPQRTELIRRMDNDQEIMCHIDLAMIFAGKEPDIYLKPYDAVMVGTNAWAPFLAAFRNAYRITYGFGFVYDRNFQ